MWPGQALQDAVSQGIKITYDQESEATYTVLSGHAVWPRVLNWNSRWQKLRSAESFSFFNKWVGKKTDFDQCMYMNSSKLTQSIANTMRWQVRKKWSSAYKTLEGLWNRKVACRKSVKLIGVTAGGMTLFNPHELILVGLGARYYHISPMSWL